MLNRHAYEPSGDFASVILGLRGIIDEMTERWHGSHTPDWQAAMMADLVLMLSDLEEMAGDAAP